MGKTLQADMCVWGSQIHMSAVITTSIFISSKKNDPSKIYFAKYDIRRPLDIRYARLGPRNALSAVPTSSPILIGKKN